MYYATSDIHIGYGPSLDDFAKETSERNRRDKKRTATGSAKNTATTPKMAAIDKTKSSGNKVPIDGRFAEIASFSVNTFLCDKKCVSVAPRPLKFSDSHATQGVHVDVNRFRKSCTLVR